MVVVVAAVVVRVSLLLLFAAVVVLVVVLTRVVLSVRPFGVFFKLRRAVVCRGAERQGEDRRWAMSPGMDVMKLRMVLQRPPPRAV